MAVTEELLKKVRELPPEQAQMVSDFIGDLDQVIGDFPSVTSIHRLRTFWGV